MWIFTFAPDWVIHAIFGLGVLGIITGFVLGFIPAIKPYKLPIQIISIIVVAFGTYLEGGLADYKEWEFRVKEMEAKIAEAQAQAAKENIKIVEKVVTKTQIVKQKGRDIIVEVQRDRALIDKECVIPPKFIEIHNKAAEPIK